MEIILLLIGAIIGGLVSWFISHRYYEKSSSEQKDLYKNYQMTLQKLILIRQLNRRPGISYFWMFDILLNSAWQFLKFSQMRYGFPF